MGELVEKNKKTSEKASAFESSILIINQPLAKIPSVFIKYKLKIAVVNTDTIVNEKYQTYYIVGYFRFH